MIPIWVVRCEMLMVVVANESNIKEEEEEEEKEEELPDDVQLRSMPTI